jgi:hypothetical protein
MILPKIDAYRFGEIIIDDQIYKKDLIITPSGVHTNWRRKKGHSLSMADLQIIQKEPIKILVIGTGFYGRMTVDKSLINNLEDLGIRVKCKNTNEACSTYSEISLNHEEIAAALHLTC